MLVEVVQGLAVVASLVLAVVLELAPSVGRSVAMGERLTDGASSTGDGAGA